MPLPRSASGWRLDDLITSVPMRLYSVNDPTEMLTLPASGPQGSTVSYWLHLKTNGPSNSTTPRPSPRKSNLEADKPNTGVKATTFLISTIKTPLRIAILRSSGFIV